MKKITKIVLWIVLIFVGIQLIPVDRTNPPIRKEKNFVDVQNPPKKVSEILKNSCYDCHSFETKYPKYAYVAPISWSIKHHINEGREHANFSVWGDYNKDIKQTILEKTIEMVRERKMPMPGYIAQHPKANLNDAERKVLTNYFEEILKNGNY